MKTAEMQVLDRLHTEGGRLTALRDKVPLSQVQPEIERLLAWLGEMGVFLGDPEVRRQVSSEMQVWAAYLFERSGIYTPAVLQPYGVLGVERKTC